ncbi:MAG: thiamine ABC transporter substrate binding subunit [Alphaproteobacteria bacterium]|jgi:thiamine transport system substrate-binding protein|nr:thiamine ABC transporter substrate binding subunit [Alphaproteobacteria bacterium]MBT4019350.1 thiamine ABC transporter substrate binding subunit [Alphaproteobacteria bacterium]MBT5161952.1 thiamine ABC transporter substrate binding subunit [Alphaproteobacteria bacterium]MBT5917177.1 thiamine ABC transporter substrate binding subunit [Alphaproteobacteria bacterium]MBT6385608.1 thiamine ABC transporter substrate binding subunit [Alphaproteobacteria bacterium]
MKRFIYPILSAALMLSATVAQAADKPKLVIYTYDAFAADWGPAPAVKKAFEPMCDCEVQFVTADSSIGILRIIQLEGASTKADIALGLDTNLTDIAQKTGLFIEHKADISELNLPIRWTNPVFLPFDYGYFSFVYDSEKIATAPTSFDELLAMPEDFKIVIQDPRSSTPGLGLLLWVRQIYGNKAPEVWKKLKPRILTITKGWSEAYGLFLKGEAEMVLSYTTSPAYHMIAEKVHKYRAAGFTDGHYMQVEVAAVVKASKQQALARKFMAFMLTPAFQDIIPTTNWMYPVAKGKDLPAGFEKLHQPNKALLMSGADVAKNRKAWVQEWLDNVSK